MYWILNPYGGCHGRVRPSDPASLLQTAPFQFVGYSELHYSEHGSAGISDKTESIPSGCTHRRIAGSYCRSSSPLFSFHCTPSSRPSFLKLEPKAWPSLPNWSTFLSLPPSRSLHLDKPFSFSRSQQPSASNQQSLEAGRWLCTP